MSKDTRLFNVMLDVSVYDALIALSRANNRALSDEARHAFARHLASPPKCGIGTPPVVPELATVAYSHRKRSGPQARKSKE